MSILSRLLGSAVVGTGASLLAWVLSRPGKKVDWDALRASPSLDPILETVGFVRADPRAEPGPVAAEAACQRLFPASAPMALPRKDAKLCEACCDERDGMTSEGQAAWSGWRLVEGEPEAHAFRLLPCDCEPAVPPVTGTA